jgi:hypothetical protein
VQTNGIIPLRNIQQLVVLLIPLITIVIIGAIMVLMIAFIELINSFFVANLCSFHYNPYCGKSFGVGYRILYFENVVNHFLSF